MTEGGGEADDQGEPASEDEQGAGEADDEAEAVEAEAEDADGEQGEREEPSAQDVLARLTGVTPAPELSPRTASIRQASAKVNLNIQKIVGYGALIVMVIQLGIADWVFIKYAGEKGWGNLPTGAIQAWLAATVVQVIAVVLVIARSVFPQGGQRS
jgi:hypothetical protein